MTKPLAAPVSQPTIECKSEEGITVGLIDSIMTAATVASHRIRDIDPDDIPESVLEACNDLFQDVDLRFLISFGGNRSYEVAAPPPEPTCTCKHMHGHEGCVSSHDVSCGCVLHDNDPDDAEPVSPLPEIASPCKKHKWVSHADDLPDYCQWCGLVEPASPVPLGEQLEDMLDGRFLDGVERGIAYAEDEADKAVPLGEGELDSFTENLLTPEQINEAEMKIDDIQDDELRNCLRMAEGCIGYRERQLLQSQQRLSRADKFACLCPVHAEWRDREHLPSSSCVRCLLAQATAARYEAEAEIARLRSQVQVILEWAKLTVSPTYEPFATLRKVFDKSQDERSM